MYHPGTHRKAGSLTIRSQIEIGVERHQREHKPRLEFAALTLIPGGQVLIEDGQGGGLAFFPEELLSALELLDPSRQRGVSGWSSSCSASHCC